MQRSRKWVLPHWIRLFLPPLVDFSLGRQRTQNLAIVGYLVLLFIIIIVPSPIETGSRPTATIMNI